MVAPKTRRILAITTIAAAVAFGAMLYVLSAGLFGPFLGVKVGERAAELRNAHAPITDRGDIAWPWEYRVTPMLPQPLENLDNDQLFDYLNTLIYDGWNNNRHRAARCRSGAPAGCPNPGDQVSVSIQPEWGAHQVPLADIDEKGVVLARITNYGSQAEGRYNIPPRSRAWWLVDRPAGQGDLRSRFIVRTLDQASPVGNHTVAYQFYDCQHEKKDHSSAMARWRDCGETFDQTATIPDGGSALLRIALRAPAAVSVSSGTWVTCTMGCCVAGAPVVATQ